MPPWGNKLFCASRSRDEVKDENTELIGNIKNALIILNCLEEDPIKDHNKPQTYVSKLKDFADNKYMIQDSLTDCLNFFTQKASQNVSAPIDKLELPPVSANREYLKNHINDYENLQTQLNTQKDKILTQQKQLKTQTQQLEDQHKHFEEQRRSWTHEQTMSKRRHDEQEAHTKQQTAEYATSDRQSKEKIAELEEENVQLKAKKPRTEEPRPDESNVAKENKKLKKIKGLEGQIQGLEGQVKDLKGEVKDLTSRLEKDTKQALIQDVLSGVKGASSTDAAVESLIGQNAVLIDRLAAEMNAKVSSNESSLENISIKNRPMNIADEYHAMMSNAWLDAKSAVDEAEPEESKEAAKVQLLCNIVMVSEKQATTVYGLIHSKLSGVLGEPIAWADNRHAVIEHGQVPPQAEQKVLPQPLINNVGDVFRSSAGDVNIEFLVQEVMRTIRGMYSKDPDSAMISQALDIDEVVQYINESARLAWKMVIQRPPMCYETGEKGQQWVAGGGGGGGSGTLELMWGSNPHAPGATVRYYKTPRLLHGGKQMVKGTAFVHNTDCPE